MAHSRLFIRDILASTPSACPFHSFTPDAKQFPPHQFQFLRVVGVVVEYEDWSEDSSIHFLSIDDSTGRLPILLPDEVKSRRSKAPKPGDTVDITGSLPHPEQPNQYSKLLPHHPIYLIAMYHDFKPDPLFGSVSKYETMHIYKTLYFPSEPRPLSASAIKPLPTLIAVSRSIDPSKIIHNRPLKKPKPQSAPLAAASVPLPDDDDSLYDWMDNFEEQLSSRIPQQFKEPAAQIQKIPQQPVAQLPQIPSPAVAASNVDHQFMPPAPKPPVPSTLPKPMQQQPHAQTQTFLPPAPVKAQLQQQQPRQQSAAFTVAPQQQLQPTVKQPPSDDLDDWELGLDFDIDSLYESRRVQNCAPGGLTPSATMAKTPPAHALSASANQGGALTPSPVPFKSPAAGPQISPLAHGGPAFNSSPIAQLKPQTVQPYQQQPMNDGKRKLPEQPLAGVSRQRMEQQ